MEATTIIEPSTIVTYEGHPYLVTTSSKQYPGSFNAYRIGLNPEGVWEITSPRREMFAEGVEFFGMPGPSPEHCVKMLNDVLFQTEAKVRDLRESVGQWSDKWEALNDALIQEATERDWCSEFEDFAEANGLRGCSREYDVTFSVEYTVSAVVTARDEDEARDKVNDWADSSYLDERVEESIRYNSPEVIVLEVEEA